MPRIKSGHLTNQDTCNPNEVRSHLTIQDTFNIREFHGISSASYVYSIMSLLVGFSVIHCSYTIVSGLVGFQWNIDVCRVRKEGRRYIHNGRQDGDRIEGEREVYRIQRLCHTSLQ